ncbi:hypothetical protein [Filomicrobium insigne]|uniref:nSTAND3 domain-containing NTPase n=1 Tax=Filomicrobium insigne TaxID=418854 RepID=UPI0011133BDD|nr:hypothetical protein [Filomicrobium insigne]
MVNKKPKPTGAQQRKNRRTAASGGAPARSRRSSGNPGYAGYEYQIEVTIWVALDLMLVKNATAEVEIEPKSDEDLQAAITDPASGSLGLSAAGERLDLVVQAKTRSGSPWTTAAIADVLLGKDAADDDARRRRSRPLAMLQEDLERRYIFITNESSAESLRPHEGSHLFDFPEVEELPPHARDDYDAEAQASLAPRIVLLTGITREVLAGRIGGLLSLHGHVPSSKHEACIADLRDAVRKRIAGAKGGRWTRSDLLVVLVRHGGSVAPTRDMDHYVRPRSFETIKERLYTSNAVVITGPSGTGKTLTADILELELRRGSPPFDVIGEEHGPGFVRQHLTRSDPILFHLRDPWGGNRITPSADRWSSELPKLLDNAGPGRKFLITSRSDVMQSAGHELLKGLKSYTVSIEVEDYGSGKLAEIYDAIAGDLRGHARALAVAYRTRALEALSRPYEVKRFLVALSRENSDQPRKVDDVIADSQIEAISSVIASQIASFDLDGVESAAIIWAMLSARGAVARDVFAKLTRRMRMADSTMHPNVEGLIDFLVAGQNLRQDGAALAFYHPRVEDGLRMTFLRRRPAAEHTLAAVVNALVAWDAEGADWGTETGLGVLRAASRVEGLELAISDNTQRRLNSYLEAVALSADRGSDFEAALRDLARFASPDHAPSRLAKILVEGGPETEKTIFQDRWSAPRLDDEESEVLRRDERTKGLIERFIREVLPFSHREYHSEVVPLLHGLAEGLQEAFWDALDVVAGPGGPNENIDAIVQGALLSPAPDFDRAIARFAKSNADADAWLENYRNEAYEAEEHAVDADAADHILEEPGEQYFNARQGMKVVVRLRQRRNGVDWIAGNPHRNLLIYALAELVAESPRKPTLAELRFLLANAEGWTRGQAWRAAQRHWHADLSDLLRAELVRDDMQEASFRQLLIEIAATGSARHDPLPALIAVLSDTTIQRRIELLYDIMAARLDEDPTGVSGVALRRHRAEGLVGHFDDAERGLARALVRVLAREEISAVAATLSIEDRARLATILPAVPADPAGPLTCLAAAAGLDVDATVQRLLSMDDEGDGSAAVQAMLIASGPGLRDELMKALKHKRYKVRRKALLRLIPIATAEDRAVLVGTSRDHSADMRLAFANLMEEHQWPEAIDALIGLLSDMRNFASQLAPAPSWSRYGVARAAARALGAYERLPDQAIDALLETASKESADPFVAGAALRALARQDDDRIGPTLLAALESRGLNDAPSYRPKAQAAAWALFDRVTDERLSTLGTTALRIAEQDDPAVAGPLLIAFGVLEGVERDALLERLRDMDNEHRHALVRTSAIAVDRADGLSLDERERNLQRLARGEALDGLNADGRATLEAWSLGLNVENGFEHYSAWIADAVFKLPLSGELGQIRAYNLPARIGLMTMRSMSPYGEENRGEDDGT